MDETTMYATIVTEKTYPSHGGATTNTRRLVVVEATTPEHARRESGLVDATFYEAGQAELEEWAELTAGELEPHDLTKLIRMVRSELIQVTNKRVRDVQLGLTGERQDRDLGKAVRLCMLRGKLVAWLAELEEDADEGEGGGVRAA